MLIRFLILIIVLFLLYLILIMPKLKHNPELNRLEGWYYAHRGLHDNNYKVPENSLKAFELAVENGYGIELDVQLTKDKVPIIMHDYSLKRACGVKKKVCDLNYDQLKKYRLFNSEEKIPTLEEVLSCINGKVPIIIELKVLRHAAEICKIVSKLLEDYEGFYVIESFNPFVLVWYKKNKPEVIRGQLSSDFIKGKHKGSKVQFFILKHMLFNVFTKPDFIAYHHIYKKELSFILCRILYKAKTVAWTVRSHGEMIDCKKYFDLFIFEGFLPSNKSDKIGNDD